MKRFIITGGGTGGHVFPGIAVAKELMKNPEVVVLFVGKKNGPEEKWVPEAGLLFEGIPASGFPRRPSWKYITFGYDFFAGLKQARELVASFKPDAVFSTGGYVSVPVSLVAASRGIPVGLLEPNVIPGLGAKFSSRFSRKIFVGFEETLKNFGKGRAQWTGIPVREEIRAAERSRALENFKLFPGFKNVLMMGGSQGARLLNQIMADAILFLGEGGHRVQVLMMTGTADYRRTVDQLEKCPIRMVVRPFFGNIQEAYAVADLVVARSGALTCAEVVSRGLPALFIPYPHASGHQEKNARALEAAGAAVVILEKELGEEMLSRTLIALLSAEEKLKTMGQAAALLAKPEAARQIAREIFEMVEININERNPS